MRFERGIGAKVQNWQDFSQSRAALPPPGPGLGEIPPSPAGGAPTRGTVPTQRTAVSGQRWTNHSARTAGQNERYWRMHSTVQGHVVMNLVVSNELSFRIVVDLEYDPSDPYAVRFTFHLPGDAPVTWVFARELLLDGISRPTGEGDV